VSALTGKVAVVTGAASGIGRALAVELVHRGARVAISDVDEPGLAETLDEIGPMGLAVHSHRVDVADREAVHEYAGTVAAHFGTVHQVYNNAGVGLSRSVVEAEYSVYERVLGVNLWGVIHGTKAFLPHLIASGAGHVINISSLNGYFAAGGLSAYCTSKFGVRGFTESLRVELLRDGHPVKVTCVHPGGVRTNIANNSLAYAEQHGPPVTDVDRARVKLYNEKLLRMDPARAATIILDGVVKGRPRIRVGNDALLLDWLVRLAPAAYPHVESILERLSIRALRRAT
jgi:NAD(P)-dependent dehydrogenase (short-subunit alcohol dehydrogenase family)